MLYTFRYEPFDVLANGKSYVEFPDETGYAFQDENPNCIWYIAFPPSGVKDVCIICRETEWIVKE